VRCGIIRRRHAIRAFRHSYESLAAGNTGLIPESGIQPVATLPDFDDTTRQSRDGALLAEAVVLKLNGGLGTSMGLEKAKSLLRIKEEHTFLDFIARQVLFLRQQNASPLRFMLMNSFSTSRDTLQFLKKYSKLGDPAQLELMQSAVPKARNPDMKRVGVGVDQGVVPPTARVP